MVNVPKVPYLLNVTNYYFSVFFGEVRMISTIKLYNSAIATGNSNGQVANLFVAIKMDQCRKYGELRP